jgi:hypothetical protein
VALDTAIKRYSAVNFGSPWRGVLPFPDGTIDQGDRQTVFFLCSSILAVALELVEPLPPRLLIRNTTGYANINETPAGFSFITTTPTAYANITTTPPLLDAEDPDA